MKRTKPLRRKTPLRSRGKTSYRRRPRDIEHMKVVRRMPCSLTVAVLTASYFGPRRVGVRLLVGHTSCEGHVQADHAGKRAFGRKAADDTTIPMCKRHHGERTDMRGSFRGWTAESMREWCDVAIYYTRGEIERMRRVLHG